MRPDWQEHNLLKVFDVTNGLTKNRKEFGFGYPFLSFKEVFNNYFVPDKLTNLANTTKKEREKCSIKKGDVFITRTSEKFEELAITCVSLKNYPNATFNGFTKRLRPKGEVEIDPEYSSFYFKSPFFRQQVLSFTTMTTRASLNNEMLEKLTIILPPIVDQRRIAKILVDLNNKIELNSQINQTLDLIAQAIFKSWFVDFDPVKAKIAARQKGANCEQIELAAMCAISGKTEDQLAQLPPETQQQLKTTAALFPDALVDSEVGEIPDGWQVQSIEDLSKTVAMGPFGSNIKVSTYQDEGVPIINGQHLSNTMLEDKNFKFISIDHADRLIKSNVKAGDIVVTHRGTIGQVSIIPNRANYKRYIVSQSQCFIRPNRDLISPLFIIYYFKSHKGQHELLSNTSQVGVPSISRPVSNLRRILIIIPNKTLSDVFHKQVNTMHKTISEKRKENLVLEKTRDTLLPKLLSGEIKLNNVA